MACIQVYTVYKSKYPLAFTKVKFKKKGHWQASSTYNNDVRNRE